MTGPSVSVVVVSRGRPFELALCLAGIAQLDYDPFEVIVVADQASRPGIGTYGRRIKQVQFEDANISAARNAGIAQAAGDIVAFIDDDAVPEPTWLRYLTGPFADEEVAATGGYVLGRNGISYQWRARAIAPDGTAVAVETPSDAPFFPSLPQGHAVKTEGTNMAVRRSVLHVLGGYDAAFAFYLDETDLNMRLAKAGARTMLAPLALVHHGYASSSRRTAGRVPRDLFDIAASTAVFQRKHGHTLSDKAERARQRQRLLRHMVAGDLMPGDVLRLMKRFKQGWQEGQGRPVDQTHRFEAAPAFKPFAVDLVGHRVAVARFWQGKRALERAAAQVQDGTRVTLYLFSLTALRHRVRFSHEGVWVQSGGQFGKSDRRDPAFRLMTAHARAAREGERCAKVRHFCEYDQNL